MPIEFCHTETGSTWRITSPQLPGWACSWPTQEVAIAQCGNSLKGYLRRNRDKLSPEIVEELRGLIASVG
jgi:hypothetical protein